jgi:hypothetical protein
VVAYLSRELPLYLLLVDHRDGIFSSPALALTSDRWWADVAGYQLQWLSDEVRGLQLSFCLLIKVTLKNCFFPFGPIGVGSKTCSSGLRRFTSDAGFCWFSHQPLIVFLRIPHPTNTGSRL